MYITINPTNKAAWRQAIKRSITNNTPHPKEQKSLDIPTPLTTRTLEKLPNNPIIIWPLAKFKHSRNLRVKARIKFLKTSIQTITILPTTGKSGKTNIPKNLALLEKILNKRILNQIEKENLIAKAKWQVTLNT